MNAIHILSMLGVISIFASIIRYCIKGMEGDFVFNVLLLVGLALVGIAYARLRHRQFEQEKAKEEQKSTKNESS